MKPTGTQPNLVAAKVIHPDVLEPNKSPGDDENAEEEMKMAMKIADTG